MKRRVSPESNSWHQTTLGKSASGWSDEVLQSNINRFKNNVQQPLGEYDTFVQETLTTEQSRREEATQESRGLLGKWLHR